MSKELIICVGTSGSGKSSWATSFIKNNPKYARINRDDIRRTIVGSLTDYYKRKDLSTIEAMVNYLEEDLLEKYVMWGYNVIIDNTNLKLEVLNQWIKLAQNNKYDIKFSLFDCKLNDAKLRVATREGIYAGFDENRTYICKETDYIDKQFEQYKEIKEYILNNYKEHLI